MPGREHRSLLWHIMLVSSMSSFVVSCKTELICADKGLAACEAAKA